MEKPIQSVEHRIDFLKTIPFFRVFRDEELKEIAVNLHYRELKENDFLFSEEDPARELFMVNSGEFELEIKGVSGKRLQPGDVFGEIALIDNQLRTGSVRALQSSEVFFLHADSIFNGKDLPPAIALNLLRQMARKVTHYLRSHEHTTTDAILEQGESGYVEFKSTLRWNIHAKKFDTVIENASLKTIVAYINTNGGTLIVGVNDDGEAIGLDPDRFKNSDKALLHLTASIKQRIGPKYMRFIHSRFEQIQDMEILRIDVNPGCSPAYLIDGQEDAFYIRTGPSSTRLRVRRIYDYIQERFRIQPED